MNAMEQNSQKHILPPYLSPVTLWNSVDLLKPVPPRIDKSVFGNQSGLVQGQLMAAYRFLKFTDESGSPQPILREVAGASKEERGPIIKRILEGAYPFLLDSTFDVSATSSQGLEEKFKALGASGQTIRKCITFFQHLAKDAGLEVSPHVKASKVGGSSGGQKRKVKRSSKLPEAGGAAGPNPQGTPATPLVGQSKTPSMIELLAGKLPPFDPTWNPDAQASWMAALDKLIAVETGRTP